MVSYHVVDTMLLYASELSPSITAMYVNIDVKNDFIEKILPTIVVEMVSIVNVAKSGLEAVRFPVVLFADCHNVKRGDNVTLSTILKTVIWYMILKFSVSLSLGLSLIKPLSITDETLTYLNNLL